MTLAIVLGGASCVLDDVKALRSLIDVDACTIVAVNDMLFRWPGQVHHFATLHPEELPYRVARREQYGYPGGFEAWTRPYPAGMKEREAMCDHVLAGWDEGSSGMFGVGILVHLGFQQIVGCGIPMDQTPHIGRTVGWTGYPSYRDGWIAARSKLAPVFRSMPGWTREQFGAPTAEWLDPTVAGAHY